MPKDGFAMSGRWGASRKPSSICCFNEDFHHLSATPHSHRGLTSNSATAVAFSGLSCGQSKEQGWNPVAEKLSVLLCLCPEGVLGQRENTKVPSWPCLLILLCLIFAQVVLKSSTDSLPKCFELLGLKGEWIHRKYNSCFITGGRLLIALESQINDCSGTQACSCQREIPKIQC